MPGKLFGARGHGPEIYSRSNEGLSPMEVAYIWYICIDTADKRSRASRDKKADKPEEEQGTPALKGRWGSVWESCEEGGGAVDQMAPLI
jgi:hypothetical protein